MTGMVIDADGARGEDGAHLVRVELIEVVGLVVNVVSIEAEWAAKAARRGSQRGAFACVAERCRRAACMGRVDRPGGGSRAAGRAWPADRSRFDGPVASHRREGRAR